MKPAPSHIRHTGRFSPSALLCRCRERRCESKGGSSWLLLVSLLLLSLCCCLQVLVVVVDAADVVVSEQPC